MTTAPVSLPSAPTKAIKGRSLWANAWRRLLRNKAAVTSAIVLMTIAFLCVVGPFFTGHSLSVSDAYSSLSRLEPRLGWYPAVDELPGFVEDRFNAPAQMRGGLAGHLLLPDWQYERSDDSEIGTITATIRRARSIDPDRVERGLSMLPFVEEVRSVESIDGETIRVVFDVQNDRLARGARNLTPDLFTLGLSIGEDWGFEDQGSTGVMHLTLSASHPIDIDRVTDRLQRHDYVSGVTIIQAISEQEYQLAIDIQRYRFLFGTESNGRDLLTLVLFGGRISLVIGILATCVSLMVGVLYGATSGFVGGRTDHVMMRIVDIMYSMPFTFLVILLMVFFGRGPVLSFVLIIVAVGAVEWLDMARIVRGQTLSIKRKEYIEAAHASGVGTLTTVRRHVIPNTLGPVVVYMTLTVPKVILLESFLSFLGLGVQAPLTSWGLLIDEGARNMEESSWMLIFPAVFLATTLFCLNYIGDGLRDALDPKDR